MAHGSHEVICNSYYVSQQFYIAGTMQLHNMLTKLSYNHDRNAYGNCHVVAKAGPNHAELMTAMT